MLGQACAPLHQFPLSDESRRGRPTTGDLTCPAEGLRGLAQRRARGGGGGGSLGGQKTKGGSRSLAMEHVMSRGVRSVDLGECDLEEGSIDDGLRARGGA
jgi:hypothetical protein